MCTQLLHGLARTGLFAILFYLLPATASAQDSEEAKKDAIAALIQAMNYGVPSSPAFELLPDKPSEITHIVTPSDLLSNATSWFDGKRLRTGFALDLRPFPLASSIGTLRQYQKSRGRRIVWRTVVSVGTVSAGENTDDVLLSVGIRIPLIDKGDPRADSTYIENLEKAYGQALRDLGQPPLDSTMNESERIGRSQRASQSERVKAVRDSLAQANWNALKLDIGLAGMLRAPDGDIVDVGNLEGNRAGVWGAFAFPLTKFGQVTISGKFSWTQTDSTTQESGRHVAGARARFFWKKWFAVSVEGAGVFSRYKDMSTLNQGWLHLAGVLEINVPFVGGWVGIAYGNDLSRPEDPGHMFSLHYALYKNQLLKR